MISSKLFKWVVINLPFAGSGSLGVRRSGFFQTLPEGCSGDFLGLIGAGAGMRAGEGRAERGRTNEATVLPHLYRVTYYR